MQLWHGSLPLCCPDTHLLLIVDDVNIENSDMPHSTRVIIHQSGLSIKHLHAHLTKAEQGASTKRILQLAGFLHAEAVTIL